MVKTPSLTLSEVGGTEWYWGGMNWQKEGGLCFKMVLHQLLFSVVSAPKAQMPLVGSMAQWIVCAEDCFWPTNARRALDNHICSSPVTWAQETMRKWGWLAMYLVVLVMSLTGSSLMLKFITRINNCSFITNSDNYEKMQAIKRSEKVFKNIILSYSEVTIVKIW